MALKAYNHLGCFQGTNRLRLNPDTSHQAECYEDLDLELSPLLFSSLERYLPSHLINIPRDDKVCFMREIVSRYSSENDRFRKRKHREYKQSIFNNYHPLHNELYNMHPMDFFVPSFLEAINIGTEESFTSIITEPIPGIYLFDMLQPSFCEMLISEVENYERWVFETKCRVMRPNTMNKYGAVLDDLGMESTLSRLVSDYISPISKVLFPDVFNLDLHHGFVVEYGANRDVELGFHVDDSEVTLNVCLGKKFSGGDLFFRGVRCEKHLNGDTHQEEFYDYTHVPGRAILHHGSHRHGARATISGFRINMVIWCRSSEYREMKRYLRDFSGWCCECRRHKKEKQNISIAGTKLQLLKREGMYAS